MNRQNSTSTSTFFSNLCVCIASVALCGASPDLGVCNNNIATHQSAFASDELSGLMDSPFWRKCQIPLQQYQRILLNPNTKTTEAQIIALHTNIEAILAMPESIAKQSALTLLSQYDKLCLAKIGEIPSYRSDQVQDILAHIVVFTSKSATVGMIPFCQGLLVNRKIVTARHCLLSAVSPHIRIITAKGPDTGQKLEDPDQAGVTIYRNNGGNWEVVHAQHSLELVPDIYRPDPMVVLDNDLNENHNLDDWVILDTSADIQDGRKTLHGGINIEDVKDQRLFLVGLNVSAIWSLLLSKEWNGTISPTQFSAMSRADYSAFCRVVYNEGRVFSHMCQTDQGVSGLPIFVQSDFPTGTALKFLGIQSSASLESSVGGDCGSVVDSLAPNHGLALPPEIVVKLFSPS